jgi:hypothetical protein
MRASVTVSLAALAGCFSGFREHPRGDVDAGPSVVTGMSDDGGAPDRPQLDQARTDLPATSPPDAQAPDVCQPLTCATAGASCGTLSNGCGGMLDCAGCPSNQTCGAAGPNKCGVGPCMPESNSAFCARLGKTCGQVTGTDSCGQERSVSSCGTCTAPQTCGGGDTPNVCGCKGESDSAFCARLGKACGQFSGTDSCGQPRAVASCGTCSAPQTCGGGGTPNACGCTKTTCAAHDANCGSISDGCGGTIPSCGMCTDPQVCGGGGANRCGCTPLTSGGTRYVDPSSGTDDAQHGGGPGSCAYKTITYAAAHAGGDIVLAKATYQAPAETFPLVLDGTRKLLCNGATLRGSGGGNKDTVEFQGTANGLDQCVVDGQQAGSMCVYVSHASGAGAVHTISKCDIQKCGFTAVYVASGNLSVSGSVIHEAPLDGILWYGTTGSMTGNQFSGNTRDITCPATTSAGITGSGNTSAGGAPVCSMCANCPF